MSALRQIFARFGVEFNDGPLQAGDSATAGLTDRLRSLGEVVAGGALVLGIRAFVGEIAGIGDELDKSSQALGLSTDALQAWRSAAGHAGVSSEQMTPALQAVRRNASAAALAAGGMRNDFRALGVTLKDEQGNLRGTDDLMMQIADGAAGMSDPTERAAILMRLMGESGARLIPLLANGSAGVREAAEAFEALGGGMSEEAIAASAAYTDRMQELDEALLGIKSRIGVEILPAISRLVEGLSRAGGSFSAIADRGHLVEVALGALAIAAVAAGGSTVVAWIAAAAPFIVLGLLIAGLILIVEDLWVGFEGGKSVLADLGNDMEDWTENATGWLEPVAGAWLLIRDAIIATVNALGEIAGMEPDWLRVNRAAPAGPTQRQMNDQRRAARAAAAAQAMGGGSVERVAAGAASGGRGGAGGPVQVTQSVRIDSINANGMTPEQAQPVIERAIARALSTQADDTLDTLTQGR